MRVVRQSVSRWDMIRRRVILVMGLVLVLGVMGTLAHAQSRVDLDPITFRPSIPIGSFAGDIPVDADLLPRYISAFYTYFLAVVGIIAVVMIMYGGFRWITAGGNPSRIGAAKEIIQSAIIGLILALTSRLILQTINPELVSLRISPISQIEQVLQLGAYCSETAEGRRAAGSTTCGGPISYSDRTGRLTTCIATKCEIATHICAYWTDVFDYGCRAPETVCEFGSDPCRKKDRALAQITPPPHDVDGNTLVCRDVDVAGGPDDCKLTPILKCPALSKRISCNSRSNEDSPCWQSGQPAEREESSIRARCTDDSRPGVVTDGICCLVEEKIRIVCTSGSPDPSVLVVPCARYNSMPGEYQNQAGPCDLTCFAPIEAVWNN